MVLFSNCGNPKKKSDTPAGDSTKTNNSGAFKTIDELDLEIQKNSKNADLWYTRGIMNHDAGDLTTAINDFSKALEINPQMASAWHDKGICNHELENYTQAIDDYSKALEIDPTFVEAYYNRAMVFDILNQRENALKDYNKIIELDPKFAPAYYNRGVYYFNFDKNKACEDFKKASDLGDEDGKTAYEQHCIPKK